MLDQVEQALNESATRVLTGLARLLPGLVALIVAVLISVLVAMLLGFLVRRSLRGVDFDAKLAGWGFSGIAELSPDQSPTLLLVRLVHWGVILLGALIGIASFDATLTEQMVTRVLAYLPNLLAAALLIIIGNVIARFLARGVLIGSVNMNLPYGRLLSLGVKWLVLVLAAAMALEHVGIGGNIVELAFGILFGGIVLTLAIGVGFGSKDMVSRSLEQQASAKKEEREQPFQHL